MSRKTRPLVALGLTAVVVLMSACGSAAPSGPASRGGDNNATNHEKAVKFAECMRNNGVSAFPDPPASGALTLDGVANGSSLDPKSAAFTQAISACRDLEPAGFMGQTPTSQQMHARLEFAQCMRENGVSDFPDPTADGPLIDTTRIPSLAGKDPRSDPAFQAAMERCRDFATAAGVARQ